MVSPVLFTNNGEGAKKKIIQAIKKHPEGLTITQLAEIVGIHRQTVTKYVLELKGEGRILRRHVGSASLHYINGNNKEEDKDEG
jgi:predicted transcriptional regulator